MYVKSWQYLILIGGVSAIILFSLFCPIYQTTINNVTMFSSLFGWKFYDGSIFIALITSVTTILITYYSVNKNYKSMKLTSLPDNSVNLLIDLELAFNKYETYKSNGNEDEFILLTEILKYWKEHQKAFKLLTPKFYRNFYMITNKYIMENNEKMMPKKNYGNENCEYILKALMAQITNIAFENDEHYFEFIYPTLITDDDIKKVGSDLDNYTTIKINKKELNRYVGNIKGETTKKLTNSEFGKLNNDLKNMLNDLKKEIEEY